MAEREDRLHLILSERKNKSRGGELDIMVFGPASTEQP